MEYEEIESLVRQEFACDHSARAVVRKERRDGVPALWLQCCACGEQLRRMSVREVGGDPSHIPPFDEQLPRRCYEERQQRRRELYDAVRVQKEEEEQRRRDGENAQWWTRYQAYITSAAWREKRRLVLERERRAQQRDVALCQGCGCADAVQVHHLSYEHFENEFLWELTAICLPCHRRLHPEGTL